MFCWIRVAADQGSAEGQYNIGAFYDLGPDDSPSFAPNYKEAMQWYRKAAAQGYALVLHHIGRLFEYGYGVDPDYEEALRWYRQAADHGDADSLTSISRVSSKIAPCVATVAPPSASEKESIARTRALAIQALDDQKYAEVVRQLQIPADLGDPNSQYILSRIYGGMVPSLPTDHIKEEMWLNKAAAACYPPAIHRLLCSSPGVKSAMQRMLIDAMEDSNIIHEKYDVIFPPTDGLVASQRFTLFRAGLPKIERVDISEKDSTIDKPMVCSVTFQGGVQFDISDDDLLNALSTGGQLGFGGLIS